MRLYSITSALLLCFSAALLCASQETPDAITYIRTPLNESDSLTLDVGRRRLFSRNDNIKGPVQTAWDERGTLLGKGNFGSVYRVVGDFPVSDGPKRVPAVIKQVLRTSLNKKWLELELIFLKTVDQLLAHGYDDHSHYIVMPYMGMSSIDAESHGFPKMVEKELDELAFELADYYEEKYGIRHLDTIARNMVLKEKEIPGAKGAWKGAARWVFAPFRSKKWNQFNLRNWEGYLVDWGYATFKSQPNLGSAHQRFTPYGN